MNVSSDRNRRIQIHRRHGIVERPGLCLRHHEIHAIFDELIHRPWGAVRWNPAVDIREDKDAFIIEMDLPGVNTEEVRVLVEGAILAIEGQRQLGNATRSRRICARDPMGGSAALSSSTAVSKTETLRAAGTTAC